MMSTLWLPAGMPIGGPLVRGPTPTSAWRTELNPIPEEWERIFRKHVNQKRNFDARSFGRCKDLVRIGIGCDQAVAFYNHPMVHLCRAVSPNPVRFSRPITERHRPHRTRILQSVGKSQHLLLLRWWKPADLFQDGLFEIHARLP